jgi:hypothetical protein
MLKGAATQKLHANLDTTLAKIRQRLRKLEVSFALGYRRQENQLP